MNRMVRTFESRREYGREVCGRFSVKELFELPVEIKLCRMTIQRDINDVAAECDIAFCDHGKFMEPLETINSDDPFKAALDHARDNDVTCFVQYGDYFGKVPSIKSDMKGWGDALKVWDQMRIERNVNKKN